MRTGESFYQALSKFRDRVQDDEFAKDLYMALCNRRWKNVETGEVYSCTWRYAGGLVAELRGKGENYMAFYCSGGGAEGRVSEAIEQALGRLGWTSHLIPMS